MSQWVKAFAAKHDYGLSLPRDPQLEGELTP